ncbi:lipopolysaccharide A protein [Pasteurellaceae bacterium 20609_3]|uniref:glycosyl transferase family 90 n=1 Tax=Spirabiliibacterium mucosae TaxID=28156 RepID=UPI001AADE19F|nr:glycosyl transferase family 90 [Spirabiliibacterium mucosae]MBE2898457.1 lipopolysaccharide A protein [Spirabiliibacterium mucosae]
MKLLSRLHKAASRVRFYLRQTALSLVPSAFARRQARTLERDWQTLQAKNPAKAAEIQVRVDYYNKLSAPFDIAHHAERQVIGSFRLGDNGSTYYLDSKPLLKMFPPHFAFLREFGDVTHIPSAPSLVKSRPIAGDNQNAVVLKLDSVRHFYVFPDNVPFEDKKPMVVWRGASHQPHRRVFLEQFHAHPLCDVGCVHDRSLNTPYHRGFLSIAEQLQYRYVLSIEGNDVATNLKWIMASNSLCFMVKPVYETWLMEGRLEAGKHYVELKSDYSDLDDKIAYYNAHPEQAKAIIANANAWMAQFFNARDEQLVSYLVLAKYFQLQQAAK